MCFQLVLIHLMECKDRKVAPGRPFRNVEAFRWFRDNDSNDTSVLLKWSVVARRVVDAVIDGEIRKIKRCQVSYKGLVRARCLFPT